MTKKISKLITYLSILQETLKVKKQTKYVGVDIELPDDLLMKEVWEGKTAPFSEQEFHRIEFPLGDIDQRIKTARDHLRYLKRRSNGHKYGE